MEGEYGDAAAADVMKRLPSAHLDSLREAVSIGFRSEVHDLSRYDRLLSLGAMEALVILVASGRHIARRDQVRSFLSDPTRAARKIFPRLVSRDPRLFIRWRTLARRLRKVLVGFRLCDGQRDTIDFEMHVEANQGRFDKIPLPPDSIVNTPAAWHEEKLYDRRVNRFVQNMLDWGSDRHLTP